MPSQKQIRHEITARIVAAIEGGTMPWRRPWRVSKNSGRPASVTTKRPYTGVNPILLEISAMQHQFQSRFWGTFQAWRQMGCCVKKRPDDVKPGEWGTTIVFCKPVKKTVEDQDNGEEKQESFFVLRYFKVFNADQCVNAEQFQVVDDPEAGGIEPDFAPAEELIAATQADIRHGGERAYYSPVGNYIQMPFRERFGSLGAYYETALHELAHWSEPRQHLDRQELGYAMCELIAEIASCFVSTEIGIPHGEGLENYSSYVKSWLDQVKGDASYVFRASKMASATCDYLLSFVREVEPVEVG